MGSVSAQRVDAQQVPVTAATSAAASGRVGNKTLL